MNSRTIDTAVEEAIQFLLRHQSPDGLWRDFITHAGEAVDWPTGYILDALGAVSEDDGFFDRCAETLISRQHDDGGWGYHERTPSDADSTASVLLFLLRIGYCSSAVDKAAHALTGFQHESGGIRTYNDPSGLRRFIGAGAEEDFGGWCQPTIEVTARAGRALQRSGKPYACAASRAWSHIKEMQLQGGSWEPYWWAIPTYATYECAAFGLAIGDLDASRRAAEWVHKQCGESEDCSHESLSAFDVALRALTLLLHKTEGDLVQQLTSQLIARQREDGSWDGDAYLRIPDPRFLRPSSYRPWRRAGRGVGVITRDHNGYFTTATVLAALAASTRAA